MQKFFAVVFLIAYSFTLIGAGVAFHKCGNQHNSVAHHVKANCTHAASGNVNCCINSQQECSLTQDKNAIEISGDKDFNKQYPQAVSFYKEIPLYDPLTVSSSTAYAEKPQSFNKLRLHLYNRVLLI